MAAQVCRIFWLKVLVGHASSGDPPGGECTARRVSPTGHPRFWSNTVAPSGGGGEIALGSLWAFHRESIVAALSEVLPADLAGGIGRHRAFEAGLVSPSAWRGYGFGSPPGGRRSSWRWRPYRRILVAREPAPARESWPLPGRSSLAAR